MIRYRTLLVPALCALVLPAAFANPTISSPGAGEVSSPFTLSADASTCSSQPVSTMGYSLDSSSDTTVVKGTHIDASVSAASGEHTVHVKAWGDKGASCVTDVAIDVDGSTKAAADESSSGSGPSIPSNATSVSSIQTMGSWKEVYDNGTTGSASGAMGLVGSPTISGDSRKFATKYTGGGGERYYTSFGDDTSAENFVYDAWVYLDSSASGVANLEMDLNQVMPNGQTVIFGFQCDGYASKWDVTKNAGSASKYKDNWVRSSQPCNVRNWTRNAWHHIEVSYSRTSSGTVTYHTVWLDGKAQAINITVYSAFALGWGPTMVTNFQVDGLGSGSNTLYLDKLTVYRW